MERAIKPNTAANSQRHFHPSSTVTHHSQHSSMLSGPSASPVITLEALHVSTSPVQSSPLQILPIGPSLRRSGCVAPTRESLLEQNETSCLPPASFLAVDSLTLFPDRPNLYGFPSDDHPGPNSIGTLATPSPCVYDSTDEGDSSLHVTLHHLWSQ